MGIIQIVVLMSFFNIWMFVFEFGFRPNIKWESNFVVILVPYGRECYINAGNPWNLFKDPRDIPKTFLHASNYRAPVNIK